MDTIDDDVLHVITCFLSDGVFTFDQEHIGSLGLREGGLLTADDHLLMPMSHRQRRLWFDNQDKANPMYRVYFFTGSMSSSAICRSRWRALRITLCHALHGVMQLSRCSATLHRRIRWASIYRELMPLQNASFFAGYGRPAIGIPSYALFEEDQHLDMDYFYLSLVRGLGNVPRLDGELDEMKRRMQKYTQRARRRERDAAPLRQAPRKNQGPE